MLIHVSFPHRGNISLIWIIVFKIKASRQFDYYGTVLKRPLNKHKPPELCLVVEQSVSQPEDGLWQL